ncbi:MAG: hypothetical protein VX397_01470, partial [Pseudomonadota bacterium]|nr:hypothetical protein [Pseudomonadota bacterium]
WSHESKKTVLADEEFYVLDGSLKINNQIYKQDSYANLPGGYPRDHFSSQEGCVALTFFSAKPILGDADSFDDSELITYINTLDMKWDSASNDPALDWMGNKRKVLKWDKEFDQQGTFIFSTPPHIYPNNWLCPTLTHPCAEETFIISGSYIGPCGKMSKGAYFWRPEYKPHGPFGTREGAFSLIRFKYGKHINIWGEEQIKYSFNANYDPILPDHLKQYGDLEFEGGESY